MPLLAIVKNNELIQIQIPQTMILGRFLTKFGFLSKHFCLFSSLIGH